MLLNIERYCGNQQIVRSIIAGVFKTKPASRWMIKGQDIITELIMVTNCCLSRKQLHILDFCSLYSLHRSSGFYLLYRMLWDSSGFQRPCVHILTNRSLPREKFLNLMRNRFLFLSIPVLLIIRSRELPCAQCQLQTHCLHVHFVLINMSSQKLFIQIVIFSLYKLTITSCINYDLLYILLILKDCPV